MWNLVLSLWTSLLLQCPTPLPRKHLAQANADTWIMKQWGYVALGFHNSGGDFNSWLRQRKAKGIGSCGSHQASGHCQFLPTSKLQPTSPTSSRFVFLLPPSPVNVICFSKPINIPEQASWREFILSPGAGPGFWYTLVDGPPQQPSISTKKRRYVPTTATAQPLLFQSGLPLGLWGSYTSTEGS